MPSLTLQMPRRAAGADALLADTWRGMTQHHAIVTPAVAFLVLLSAGLQRRSPADPISRLKTLPLGPGLDRFPLWRDTLAVKLDAPRPDDH